MSLKSRRKSAIEIDLMRHAGRVVGAALAAAQETARPGVTLAELDAVAEDTIRSRGAEPLFKNYHPSWSPTAFPGTICASVNDVVVHGIPGDTALIDGDLVSIDCGARLDGWCGDAAVSFVVGRADPADDALVAATRDALDAGIAAARPGETLGDVGFAIANVARGHGYGLLAHHGGHGIGREMHEPPSVANEGIPGHGPKLVAGLVLALEPMVIGDGTDAYAIDDDGWTIRTASGARAAHCEHTIAITERGATILTTA